MNEYIYIYTHTHLAQFYNKDRIIGLLYIFAPNEYIDNVILIHRVYNPIGYSKRILKLIKSGTRDIVQRLDNRGGVSFRFVRETDPPISGLDHARVVTNKRGTIE